MHLPIVVAQLLGLSACSFAQEDTPVLISSDSGGTYCIGDTVHISWSASPEKGVVILEFLAQGGRIVLDVIGFFHPDGDYDFLVEDSASFRFMRDTTDTTVFHVYWTLADTLRLSEESICLLDDSLGVRVTYYDAVASEQSLGFLRFEEGLVRQVIQREGLSEKRRCIGRAAGLHPYVFPDPV